jgi:MFS family permease
MLTKLAKIYHEFPSKFWIVVLVSFIDRIGGTLLFPFFSLYITQKFGIGMTQAGIILGAFSLFGLIGSMLGGALTDRFGRRRLILFGLVFSAVSTLSLGLANTLAVLYPLVVVIGLLSNISGPAHNAMIADLLPEKQRSEGFGILRVVGNLAWIIGPTIGGLVAARSFFLLFVIDSVLSCIVALLFYKLIPETRPAAPAEKSQESVWQTVAGYRHVLRDFAFMAFLLASMLMLLVYQQMYNTLPVYLRDTHGFTPSMYGFLLTSSAITVVLFQFWVTRRVKDRPPFLMMALGVIFYALGFGMFGFVSAYVLFVLAVVIITIGEMIMMPVSQALAANFAPLDMRGRYMAVFGLSWAIPSMVGPGAAGWILGWGRDPVPPFRPELLCPAAQAWVPKTFCCQTQGRAAGRIGLLRGRQADLSSIFRYTT